jgi:hypothetical protein
MVVVHELGKRFERVKRDGSKVVVCKRRTLRLVVSNWLEEREQKIDRERITGTYAPAHVIEPEDLAFEQSSREIEPMRRKLVLQSYITHCYRFGGMRQPSITVKEKLVPSSDEEYRREKTRAKVSNARRFRISNERVTIRGAHIEDEYYISEVPWGWMVRYVTYDAIPRKLN